LFIGFTSASKEATVLSIAWFLVLGINFFQSQVVENRDGPLKLYQQAANILRSETPAAAIPILEQLVALGDKSKLTPIGAIRLAECYLANNKQRQALQLLLDWNQRFENSYQNDLIRKLEPELVKRANHLIQSALAQLPENELDFLEQLAKDRKVLDDPSANTNELKTVDSWLLAELARRYAKSHRYELSYQALLAMGDSVGPTEKKLRQFEIPIAALLNKPTVEMISALEHHLKSQQWSSAELFSATMAVAEAHRKLGNNEAAKSALDQLSLNLDQQQDQQIASSEEMFDWRATVELRRAELMVLLGQFNQAKSAIADSLAEYPTYPELSQFRILAARCAIAEIEFDGARDQLEKVINSSSSSPTLIAQAKWMLGEIYFLQRNTQVAIEHYRQVLEIPDQQAWHARSLLQLAKCHELQAEPNLALEAYQSILTRHPSSDVVVVARSRVSQLTNQDTTLAKLPVSQASENKLPAIQR
jgi:tetratricopeptide (TPR) repeat protein